ncbi:hypothetical protein BV20DRAFT_949876 [Pilatotrama ljubarskyi]|nr:hypothetical protein BV20DRAFT_949876 [Pilatotrama ljubarskyi]
MVTAFHLKENGVISERARHMIRELVKLNVPVNNVSDVILAVAEAMGMDVQGSVHKRSVSRIVLEGLVAAKIQIVSELTHAEAGVTISGDGTNHKNVNFESCNLYLNYDDTHVRRFLGIHSAPNHTSEQQLAGWQARFQDLYDTYNRSPQGKAVPRDARELPCMVVGMTTDHANDQKKLHRLMKEWKMRCDRELRGERAVMLMLPEELSSLLHETSVKAITEAGDQTKWEATDDARKQEWSRTILQQLVDHLGKAEYDNVPEEEKRRASLFVSGFCCMHKELNAVKGGNARMVAAWAKLGLTPPLVLMNKENAAAAECGPSDAQDRAMEVSDSGGVKTTNLAGLIFRHKDDKKGQQDTFRIFFEASSAVGAAVHFPDTSNTRYQSHCEAAAELLVHLDLYIEFLAFVRDKKTKRTFNNLENNVYRALHDIPTLTELCALTLYSQSVSHPYLRQVRGHNAESSNHLDLGPLHTRVKAHLTRIIQAPGLLLAPDASYEHGTLDGKPWERPEAFYSVHRLARQLPDLEVILVEFFRGALDTWELFAAEFAPGGLISTLSSAERKRAWMRTTNDDNEGALGEFRVCARRAPSLTLHQHNARKMYKVNGTGDFMKTHLSPEGHSHVRAEARVLDSSGLERKRKWEQAEADKRAVGEKRLKDQEKVKKDAEKRERLDKLPPLPDTVDLSKLNVTNLDLYLDWHRQFDSSIPMKSKLTRKAAKVEALHEAIQRHRDSEMTTDGSQMVRIEACGEFDDAGRSLEAECLA